MKKLLITLLGIGYVIFFAGVALIGSHFYVNHNAANGGGMPAESALQVVSGKVVQGSEITLETKRRRGPDRKEVFYELEVVPEAGGAPLKLRLQHDIPRASVEATLQENITAKYDASDENMTYDVKMGNETVVAYAERAAKAQATADKQAAFFGDGAMLQAGIWWVAIGGALLFWRRRLQKSLQAVVPVAVDAPKSDDAASS